MVHSLSLLYICMQDVLLYTYAMCYILIYLYLCYFCCGDASWAAVLLGGGRASPSTQVGSMIYKSVVSISVAFRMIPCAPFSVPASPKGAVEPGSPLGGECAHQKICLQLLPLFVFAILLRLSHSSGLCRVQLQIRILCDGV